MDAPWTSEHTWASENTWTAAKTEPAAPGVRIDVGDQLGPYRLVSVLGSGGMGTVFAAEHEMIGRRVAVKVLHPDYALKPEIARRFMMEARLANSIASDSVVEVEDFVRTPEGLCYLVMELLSGADLTSAVVVNGPLPIERSLPIVRQVAEALAAAHQAHIIHRDLKPENIFLIQKGARRDVVKLLDFGLAKLNESQVGADATQVGTVLGTPAYMSPEQAFALNVDHRTDIYALGVVLFWLVSGRLPFQGDIQAQRDARQRPPPPLPPKTPAGDPVPERLASLVADCLAQDPTARPQSMRAVIERLDALSKPPSVGELVRARARPLLAGAALLTALALLAAGGWRYTRPTHARPAPTAPETASPSEPEAALPLAPVPTAAAPAPAATAAPRPALQIVAIGTPAPAPHVKKPALVRPPHHRALRPAGHPSPAAPPPDAFAPLPDR